MHTTFKQRSTVQPHFHVHDWGMFWWYLFKRRLSLQLWELSPLLLLLLSNFIFSPCEDFLSRSLDTGRHQQPNFPACLVAGLALFTKLTVKLLGSTWDRTPLRSFSSRFTYDSNYTDRRTRLSLALAALNSVRPLPQYWTFKNLLQRLMHEYNLRAVVEKKKSMLTSKLRL